MTASSRFLFLAFAIAGAASAAGCGSSSKEDADAGDGGDGDADTDTDADSDGDADGGTFDPEDPGLNMMLLIGYTYMMNSPIEMAVGSFMMTAREDFDADEADQIPIDTCVVQTSGAAVSECGTDTDCAPEQSCLTDTDNGAMECVTPREPLDVGPVEITGAASGPLEISYNSAQSGGYTTAGSDGTLPAGTLAFDATYTFSGAGSAEQGLGPFAGELYMAPQFELTSPPLVEMSMEGMYGIEASTAAELALEWSGSSAGGELTLTIAGGQSDGTSVVCRVTDDGAFTIPAEMMASSGLGAMAFVNMLTVERRAWGSVSGEGLTFHEIQAMQSWMINIIKTN
jgi:hypothetical protein